MVAGGLRTGAEEVALVPAEAPRQPDRQQRLRLRDLLRYNLKTVRAYLLKEDFQQFWDYDSPTWAGKFLDDWCRQDPALPHRADEEVRQDAARAPRADAQLLPGQKAVLQWGRSRV